MSRRMKIRRWSSGEHLTCDAKISQANFNKLTIAHALTSIRRSSQCLPRLEVLLELDSQTKTAEKNSSRLSGKSNPSFEQLHLVRQGKTRRERTASPDNRQRKGAHRFRRPIYLHVRTRSLKSCLNNAIFTKVPCRKEARDAETQINISIKLYQVTEYV